MVQFEFDDESEALRCEGCGEEIPAFLDGCPYCDANEGEDEVETWPCPSCRALIHPDSQRCSVCGDWVTPRLSAGSGSRLRLGLIAVVLVAALLTALWLMR